MNGARKIYKQGCFGMLESRVEKGAKVLIGVGIGIAFVEVIIIPIKSQIEYYFTIVTFHLL